MTTPERTDALRQQVRDLGWRIKEEPSAMIVEVTVTRGGKILNKGSHNELSGFYQQYDSEAALTLWRDLLEKAESDRN